MSLGSVSLNMFWSPSIKGSSFLQASMKGIHTYAGKLHKVNILGATKFPLLNRNMKQLQGHLGHIRKVSAQIANNPIKLDIKTSRNSLKEARKDMTALQQEAKQYAFFTRKANENLNKPIRPYSNPINNKPKYGVKDRVKEKVKNRVKRGGAIAGGTVVGSIMALNPIRKSIEFESAMADVVKATDADKQQAELLKANILQQTKKGSILTSTQIAQIQAGGGRSGVAIKDLPMFTSIVAKASVAMDLSTGESSRDLAKMAERMDLPINKLGILTNAFTHLENTGSNSARDMINTSGRLSAVYKLFNFKPKNSAAISNYMNTLEVSPELAASSFQILTDRLTQTNSKFGYANRLSKNGALELKSIIQDITSTMSNEQMIDNFGTKGAGIITKMAKNYKTLDKSLAVVGTKKMRVDFDKKYNPSKKLAELSDSSTAVEKEYQVKISTTGAKELMAQNRITGQSIKLGDELKDTYIELYNGLSTGIIKATSFYKENKEVIHTVGSLILKIGAVALGIKAIQTISSPFVSLISGAWKFRNQLKTGVIYGYRIALGVLSVGGKVAGGVLKFVGRASLWLGRILLANPIGLVLTAIAGAGYLIYKNWDYLKNTASKLWESIANKIKAPIVKVFNWFEKKYKMILGAVDKVKNFKSNVVTGAKEKASKYWNKTKNLFGFGTKDKKETLQKPKILKSLTPVNNPNYKTPVKTSIVENKKVDITSSKIERSDLKLSTVETKKETTAVTPNKTILHDTFQKPKVNNSFLGDKKGPAKVLPIEQLSIPKVHVPSVSEVTAQTITEQKEAIQNNSSKNQQTVQNITQNIQVTAVDGKVDYEDLKEKFIRVQKELASEQIDTTFEDAS